MDSLSPRSHQLSIAPKLGVGPRSLSPSWLECWMAWSSTGLVKATTASVSSWVQRYCHVQKTLFHRSSSQPLSLTIFPPTFLAMGPGPCGRGYNIDNPFMAKHTTILHSDQLWVVLTTVHWAKKLFSYGFGCTNQWVEIWILRTVWHYVCLAKS